MTDPISDFLTRIRNGYQVKKEEIEVPHSKNKEVLAKLLSREKYIGQVEVIVEKEKKRKKIKITLLYDGKVPKITEIKRISRPGRRIYVKSKNVPKVLGGLGIAIVSTPGGLLTDREARKKNLGGELICKIW